MAHDDGRNALDDELIARLLSEDQAHVDPFEDADDSHESYDSRDARRKRRKKKRGDLLVPTITHPGQGTILCMCQTPSWCVVLQVPKRAQGQPRRPPLWHNMSLWWAIRRHLSWQRIQQKKQSVA